MRHVLGILVVGLLLGGCRKHADDVVVDTDDTVVLDTRVDDTDVVDTVVVDTVVVDTVVDDTDVDPPAPPVAECDDAGDCVLWESCCDCLGVPAGVDGPSCGVPECFATACAAGGLGTVAATCAAGRCVLDVSCDATEVRCRSLPPTCPVGQVASVIDGCWGGCVPITECRAVTSAAVCAAVGAVAVTETSRPGTFTRCVAAPAGCDDCACLGPSVCVGLFDACSDQAPGQLACSCPTCR